MDHPDIDPMIIESADSRRERYEMDRAGIRPVGELVCNCTAPVLLARTGVCRDCGRMVPESCR